MCRVPLSAAVHDRMTEMPYPSPLTTFETGIQPEKTTIVKILENGRPALEEVGGGEAGAVITTVV